jgi:hypothetical protein
VGKRHGQGRNDVCVSFEIGVTLEFPHLRVPTVAIFAEALSQALFAVRAFGDVAPLGFAA